MTCRALVFFALLSASQCVRLSRARRAFDTRVLDSLSTDAYIHISKEQVAALQERFAKAKDGELRELAALPKHPSSLLDEENHLSTLSLVTPVVVAPPSLEELARKLRAVLGCSSSDGPKDVYFQQFPSKDWDLKFKWQEFVGREVIFLFDTVTVEFFFMQLALLQALQGFPVPRSGDEKTKWKTYFEAGALEWGRASKIHVVMPWYRPAQMERTSRWEIVGGVEEGAQGFWTNKVGLGSYLDVPSALLYARLLSTPGPTPPSHTMVPNVAGSPAGPTALELVFVELHEEKPVSHAADDLPVTMRMERYVPYFLEWYDDNIIKADKELARANFYVLFPDHGAYDRYLDAVKAKLQLPESNILYLDKSRTGSEVDLKDAIFFDDPTRGIVQGEKLRANFTGREKILIIDDFTNSGSTLFGAVDILHKRSDEIVADIYVSHLMAGYSEKVVVEKVLKEGLSKAGKSTTMYVTNSISPMTDLVKGNEQVKVLDLSPFIARILGYNAEANPVQFLD